MKSCRKCGSTERYENDTCRPCSIAQAVSWAKKNPVKVLFTSNKTAARKGGFTPMTLVECQKAIAAKPVLCESCNDRPATQCDHDHQTGVFRGWLCKGCNISEGSLETPERAEALARYMKRHKK